MARKQTCLRGHDTSTPDKRTKWGQCIACLPEDRRAHYRRHSERLRAKQRRLYQADPAAHNAKSVQWRRDHPEATQRIVQRGNHKRNALERAVFVEEVRLEVLYARDGGICRLCLHGVSTAAVPLSAGQATIDHIVPLSRKGEHSYANTRLAHLSCNKRKGRKLDCELQLPFPPLAA